MNEEKPIKDYFGFEDYEIVLEALKNLKKDSKAKKLDEKVKAISELEEALEMCEHIQIHF